MHRVLYLEEFLRDTFSYFRLDSCIYPPLEEELQSRKDILSLARVCKAFKAPALDMLWECLQDLSPLVRCLPEASWVNSDGVYSFNRSLEQADWDTILDYSRRVRALPCLHGSCGLTVDCIEKLSTPPLSTVSVFPRLREVALQDPAQGIDRFLRHLMSPRLTFLYLERTENLGNAIDAFGERCPNIRSFTVWTRANHDSISNLICHWPNLSFVDCKQVDLSVAAFSHLSCSHKLGYLSFYLHDELVDWIQSSRSGAPIITFSALRSLGLFSRFLASGWRFIRHMRLPAIRNLSIASRVISTVYDLVLLLAALQETCAHHTLKNFSLILGNFEFESSSDAEDLEGSPPYHITFDHLYPLTVFVNIRSISVGLCCGVYLNERELLCLASSWPRLERFLICHYQHWSASSGITPGGFVQLLERCKSLRMFHFMFDTRGYTEVPQGHPWHGLTMKKRAFLHFQSSPIEEESIGALAAFFHVAPYPAFSLDTHWNDPDSRDNRVSEELCNLYHDRWMRVDSLARKLWEERRDLRRSLVARFPGGDVH